MTIQTFAAIKHTAGDYAKWHPHIHSSMADGLFRRNRVFHVLSKLTITPPAKLSRSLTSFSYRSQRLVYVERGRFGWWCLYRHDYEMATYLCFSVDNSVCIGRDDEAGITDLAQYIIHSPFSTKKISYNDDTGMVIHRSKMTHGEKQKELFHIFCRRVYCRH